MAGIMAPDRFPIRNPEDPNQVNGRVVNPVRYQEMGGLTGERKWASGNQMAVEKPTRVRAAHSSTNRNVE
jgi:hypothetical protein